MKPRRRTFMDDWKPRDWRWNVLIAAIFVGIWDFLMGVAWLIGFWRY